LTQAPAASLRSQSPRRQERQEKTERGLAIGDRLGVLAVELQFAWESLIFVIPPFVAFPNVINLALSLHPAYNRYA
jgi:hypothetical protein